jgi:hypothetical protein
VRLGGRGGCRFGAQFGLGHDLAVDHIRPALAIAQTEAIGELVDDPTGEVKRLLGPSQRHCDAACGEPVLTGKDGSKHGPSIPEGPRP